MSTYTVPGELAIAVDRKPAEECLTRGVLGGGGRFGAERRRVRIDLAEDPAHRLAIICAVGVGPEVERLLVVLLPLAQLHVAKRVVGVAVAHLVVEPECVFGALNDSAHYPAPGDAGGVGH